MCITAGCPDPTDVGIWWRDDSSWKLYSKDSMLAILQALLNGATSLQLDLLACSAHPHGASYLIDLSKMEQTNKASGHKRAIKLILPSHYPPTSKSPVNKEPHGAATRGDFLPPRFRLQGSNCLLVIRPGNIAEWKVDGAADAVVIPCSMQGARRFGAKGRGLKSAQTLQELLTAPSHMLDESKSIRSVQISGKIAPRTDEVEQLNVGGVAAALHQAAGPQLQVALQKSVHFANGKGQCGDVVVTPGFNLPAAQVVHAFTPPVYRKHDELSSLAKLEKTYKSALSLAALNGIQYIAFPAMACGAGGFPLELAARVALQAICDSQRMLEIHFVLLDQNALWEWIAQACKSFSRV